MSPTPGLPGGDPLDRTRYEGWVGWLCETIPIFDAGAPGAWRLAYRAVSKPSRYQTEADVTLTGERRADGWYVQGWDFLKDDPSVLGDGDREWLGYVPLGHQ